MNEQTLILRIARLKDILRYSMIQHLPKEEVMDVLKDCTERRIDTWYSDLHRREVNRRAILKGLILPSGRSTLSTAPKIKKSTVVDSVLAASKEMESSAPESKTSVHAQEINQLMNDLFDEVITNDSKGVLADSQERKSVGIPKFESIEEQETPPVVVVKKTFEDEPVCKVRSEDEGTKVSSVVDNSRTENVEEAIPLITPIKPKRRATQKKMLRTRVAQKSDSSISKKDVFVDTNESPKEESTHEFVCEPVSQFSVIEDPELQLIPKVEPPKEEEKHNEYSIEDLCDALDAHPEDIALRMKRGAYYEQQGTFVFALSDYRKAAEQNHQPAWDAYIHLLLKCNLKVRAAEAEAQRAR